MKKKDKSKKDSKFFPFAVSSMVGEPDNKKKKIKALKGYKEK